MFEPRTLPPRSCGAASLPPRRVGATADGGRKVWSWGTSAHIHEGRTSSLTQSRSDSIRRKNQLKLHILFNTRTAKGTLLSHRVIKNVYNFLTNRSIDFKLSDLFFLRKHIGRLNKFDPRPLVLEKNYLPLDPPMGLFLSHMGFSNAFLCQQAYYFLFFGFSLF